MKKIIALAVATAISAPAMADLTIGGSAGVALSKVNGNYGLGLEDFAVTLAASKEFGSSSISASSSMALTSETNDVASKNTSVVVANAAAGSLQVAYVNAGPGFGVDGVTEEVGGTGRTGGLELVRYTLPTIAEGVKVQLTRIEGEGTNASSSGIDYAVSMAVGGVNLYGAVRPKTDRVRVKATTSMGGVALGVAYEDAGNAKERTSLSASYTMDATTLAASWADASAASTNSGNGYKLTVTQDLGNGVAAEVSYKDADSMADAATAAKLTFAF